jgi:hypothetical protein
MGTFVAAYVRLVAVVAEAELATIGISARVSRLNGRGRGIAASGVTPMLVAADDEESVTPRLRRGGLADGVGKACNGVRSRRS